MGDGRSQSQESRVPGAGADPLGSYLTESSNASMAICVRKALQAQFGIKYSAGRAVVHPVP